MYREHNVGPKPNSNKDIMSKRCEEGMKWKKAMHTVRWHC